MIDFDRYYRSILPSSKAARILDVGFGSGSFLDWLNQNQYTEFFGVDIDAAAVEAARPRLGSRVKQISDLTEFLESAPKHWRAIVAADSLYYVEASDLPVVLRRCSEALEDDGVFIAVVLNAAAMSAFYTTQKDLSIKYALSEASIRRLWTAAGFSVESIKPERQRITGPISALQRVVAVACRAFLKACYFSERGLDSENPRYFDKSLVVVARPIRTGKRPLSK